MICYICRRDQSDEKLSERRCADRAVCRRVALARCKGLVVGVYRRGRFAGQPRLRA